MYQMRALMTRDIVCDGASESAEGTVVAIPLVANRKERAILKAPLQEDLHSDRYLDPDLQSGSTSGICRKRRSDFTQPNSG